MSTILDPVYIFLLHIFIKEFKGKTFYLQKRDFISLLCSSNIIFDKIRIALAEAEKKAVYCLRAMTLFNSLILSLKPYISP